MNILMIEDEEVKARRIESAVRKLLPSCQIKVERSVNSGLAALVEFTPDLLLLDMSLTTFSVGPREAGGRPQNFGGIEVLDQMERLELEVPTIIITQFETFRRGSVEISVKTIRAELEQQYKTVFRSLISYNSADARWEKELGRSLMDPTYRGGNNGKGTNR
ncbi:response regulator [Microvirga sp. M2]|uniref:response regulator n=1 Tax=Microvirga sp. M2 TaxID=3073270 RepID=UPI0039C4B219